MWISFHVVVIFVSWPHTKAKAWNQGKGQDCRGQVHKNLSSRILEANTKPSVSVPPLCINHSF